MKLTITDTMLGGEIWYLCQDELLGEWTQGRTPVEALRCMLESKIITRVFAKEAGATNPHPKDSDRWKAWQVAYVEEPILPIETGIDVEKFEASFRERFPRQRELGDEAVEAALTAPSEKLSDAAKHRNKRRKS